MKKKNTFERGLFKDEINAALFKKEDIKSILLGNTDGMSVGEVRTAFKERVKSHLFIDDTIEDTASYIFYDVRFPNLSPHIKSCQVIMYAICHRDILDDYTREGYYGNRADILSEMIEDCLINDKEVANSFGIGELSLDSVDIYNSKRFYGCIMTFNVPNFR